MLRRALRAARASRSRCARDPKRGSQARAHRAACFVPRSRRCLKLGAGDGFGQARQQCGLCFAAWPANRAALRALDVGLGCEPVQSREPCYRHAALVGRRKLRLEPPRDHPHSSGGESHRLRSPPSLAAHQGRARPRPGNARSTRRTSHARSLRPRSRARPRARCGPPARAAKVGLARRRSGAPARS